MNKLYDPKVDKAWKDLKSEVGKALWMDKILDFIRRIIDKCRRKH